MFHLARRRGFPFYHSSPHNVFAIFACWNRNALLFTIRIAIGSPTWVPDITWKCAVDAVGLELYAIVTSDITVRT